MNGPISPIGFLVVATTATFGSIVLSVCCAPQDESTASSPNVEQAPTVAKNEGDQDMHLTRIWSEYGSMANLIEALPAWTETGPTSQDDWAKIVRLAAAFQQVATEDMECALVVYMNRHPYESLVPSQPHPWTRPFLLFRAMFNLPETPLTDQDRGTWIREEQIAITPGPMGWRSSADGRNFEPAPSLAIPVRWTPEGPQLTAFAILRGVGTSGNVQDMYQPHIEYRTFVKKYGFRDLAPYLDGSSPTWERLLHEQVLPPDVFKSIYGEGDDR